MLRRHGITSLDSTRLTMEAVRALIDGQARADRDAGLDWTRLDVPAAQLDAALRRAHARLPIALEDPAIYAYREDQRRALAARLGVPGEQAGDLSRWLLGHPDTFEAGDLRCWRIASATWLALADEQLPAGGARGAARRAVPRAAERGEGWQLAPVLSLDAIRLVHSLGGRIEYDLRSAVLPLSAGAELLERVNPRTLHAGPNEHLDSAAGLSQALTRELGAAVSPGVAREKRDRWGRLLVRRRPCTGPDGTAGSELVLRVLTIAARAFPRRRVGAAPRDEHAAQPSAAMELGEAVQSAIERELPLLLSSEAAGQLRDSVRIGRMKGRPGALTITTADGVSASTRRVVAEQAVPELRALRDSGAKVTLDAGARQLVRMTLARPLADDPILLGRQKQLAALKVVGSGVDASQVGTGKTITTGRALAHRASTTQRFRALVIAEGRLLGQWRDELTAGAPGRGLPPLAPNVELLVLDDRRSIAGQIRAFDRALGERPGVVLAPNGTLDRHPAELEAIAWHLLIADEALRYANPATDAHQALAQVRMGSRRGLLAADRDAARQERRAARRARRPRRRRRGDDPRTPQHARGRRPARRNPRPPAARELRPAPRARHPPGHAGLDARRAPRPAARASNPTPALHELLEAIRRGGREAYRRLLGLLGELKALDPGGELHTQALAELARVQGVVLGNVGVYLDASVDPETLLHSKAALAKALTRQGLVRDAMRGGGDGLPLLRGITAQTIAGVTGEEQVIVFADRVRCLRQLAHTLRERHGVDAHVGDGSTKAADFEELKRRFCAREFPVLCLSRIGHEGHNLQTASVLVHLDLPWLPSGLEQRVGRAARPGAARGAVQTYIPYIKGAGIEHVVSVLSPRGGEHHQILDSFEGVHAAESTIATQLGAITGQVADAKDQAGYAGTAARLRVAAAVFGC